MFRGNGNYSEKEDLTARLPDADERSFGLFTQWLYTYTDYDDHATQILLSVRGKYRTLTLLESAKLYQLASFLQCDSLKHAIASAALGAEKIWDSGKRYFPDGETVQYLYDNFESGSELRTAAVKLLIAACNIADLDRGLVAQYPPEFLWDVALERHSKVPLRAGQKKKVNGKVENWHK